MNTLDFVDQASLRDDIPAFGPGDTVNVHVKVIEGSKERIQVFKGVVLRRQGGGVRETFTVRKESYGVGVERTFPVHSPNIDHIDVRHPRRRASRQAVLPARAARQEGEDQGKALTSWRLRVPVLRGTARSAGYADPVTEHRRTRPTPAGNPLRPKPDASGATSRQDPAKKKLCAARRRDPGHHRAGPVLRDADVRRPAVSDSVGVDGTHAARLHRLRRRPDHGRQGDLPVQRAGARRRRRLQGPAELERRLQVDPLATTPASRWVQNALSFVGFVPPDENDLVKRVIAVGGQTVECRADTGLTVDGKTLQRAVPRSRDDDRRPRGLPVPGQRVRPGQGARRPAVGDGRQPHPFGGFAGALRQHARRRPEGHDLHRRPDRRDRAGGQCHRQGAVHRLAAVAVGWCARGEPAAGR